MHHDGMLDTTMAMANLKVMYPETAGLSGLCSVLFAMTVLHPAASSKMSNAVLLTVQRRVTHYFPFCRVTEESRKALAPLQPTYWFALILIGA